MRKAPSEAQVKREWSLPDQDAKQLEQEGAYVQVSQLTVPQQSTISRDQRTLAGEDRFGAYSGANDATREDEPAAMFGYFGFEAEWARFGVERTVRCK